MEQNFQTSFIPKKPMIEERVVAARPVSLFTILSIFVLIGVVVLSGGFYVYRGVLNSNIAKMTNDLNLAKNRFEPSKITELQTLDRRLNAATQILQHHIAVTPIFALLQSITMKTVRYSSFTYDVGTDPASKVKVIISGQAVGYRSIALQADLFTANKNLIDPIFSNLVLDDKGNVNFSLTFSVDPSFVDYKQMLQTESGNMAPTPAPEVSVPVSNNSAFPKN